MRFRKSSMVAATVLLVQPLAALASPVTHYGDEHMGVGIEFTPAYATIAASFSNGSHIPLARVEGDEAWQQVMFALSMEQHLLASTADQSLSTITAMVHSLLEAGEPVIGQEIKASSLSLPIRTQTSRWGSPVADLIQKALQQADIEYVQIISHTQWGDPLLHPQNSILAGHNLSLCQPWAISETSCLDSNGNYENLAPTAYYFVGYYDNVLEVSTEARSPTAYGTWAYPYVSYELGAEARNRNPDEGFYWEEVRKHLSMPLIEFPHRKPDRVILYGDQSADEKLKRVISEIMRASLSQDEIPEWVDDDVDPTFAGAFGAAEFAKRKPFWEKQDASFVYSQQQVL